MSPEQQPGRPGIEANVAREAGGAAGALRDAAAGLAATLHELSDPGLGDAAREESTEQMYAQLIDAFQAAGDLADGLRQPAADELEDQLVGDMIEVHPLRWRRHGWGRGPRVLG